MPWSEIQGRDLSWVAACKYKLVNTLEAWREWASRKTSHFVLDLETTGLNTYKDEIVGVALCNKEYEAIYVPISHEHSNMEDVEQFFKELEEYAAEAVMIMHNAKFDLGCLANIRFKYRKTEDTIISYFLTECDKLGGYGLKDAIDKYLKIDMIHLKDLFPPKTKDLNFRMLDPTDDAVMTYGCADADMTFRFYNLLKPIRVNPNNPDKYNFIYNLENNVLQAVIRMENNRVQLDTDYLARLCVEAKSRTDKVLQEIFTLAECKFNVGSSQQLAMVFEKLNIPFTRNPETGNPILGKLQLEEIGKTYKIASLVIDYRSYRKSLTTYLITLYKWSKTGRVKFRFNQCAAPTGRFSSGKDKSLGGNKKKDDGYIPINAQAIPSNDGAVWVDVLEIGQRRLKEEDTLCYEYVPWELPDEFVEEVKAKPWEQKDEDEDGAE